MTTPFVVAHPRVTGFLLLLPVPLGLLGSLSSRQIVPGDAAATADNILASESVFRLGVLCTLGLLTADAILLTLVFYPLLRPVNRNLAVLMAALNLLGVAIAMLNEVSQLAVPLMLRDPAVPPAQSRSLVFLLLDIHDTGSLIAGIFWGLWLVPYAMLVYRSGFLPRFFAALLLVECLGFLTQSLGGLLSPDLSDDLASLPAVTSLVELFLPVWLLVRGLNVERWNRHALQGQALAGS